MIGYSIPCGYKLGIKNVYLYSDPQLKNILIDNAFDANINGNILTSTLIGVDASNISFTESESLDERYLFEKTVQFTIRGFGNLGTLGYRRYVVLEDYEGTFWLVNVDFQSDLTYEFTLDETNYNTRYTFHSYSNYPTLRILNFVNTDIQRVCGYNVGGIEKILLSNNRKIVLDRSQGVLTQTEANAFVDVDFLSASFSEAYSNKGIYTDTLTITIPLNGAWQYVIEQFKDNAYSAIIKPIKGKNIFAGINLGLQPLYSIDGNNVTITFKEESWDGGVQLESWTEAVDSATTNVYIGKPTTSECVANGRAMYLLQKEIDVFGNESGNYYAYSGYSTYFADMGYNVVGEFSEEQVYSSPYCYMTGEDCSLTTDIPLTIHFYGSGSTSYSISGTCDWEIIDVPSGITVSPSSGEADNEYTITITNSDATPRNVQFYIKQGDVLTLVNVRVHSSGFITPSTQNIDSASQTVPFTNTNPDCYATLSATSNELVFSYQGGTINVDVTENTTSSARSFTIIATDCNGKHQTLTINQDKLYSEWRETEGRICESGVAYYVEALWTGRTSSSMTMTETTRKGTAISGSTECLERQTRWVDDGGFMCYNGDKYTSLEEQESYDGGQTWSATGNVNIGELIETSSEDCNSAQYRWILTDNFICQDDL